MLINKIIKSILRNVFGVELLRTRNLPPSPSRQDAMKVVASLKHFDIDLILDVGANTGQFASEVRSCGYAGRIVSFEPLTLAHDKLVQACAGDSLWDAYPRCALGDQAGEIEINIASNSVSSSILPMLESLLRAAPYSA